LSSALLPTARAGYKHPLSRACELVAIAARLDPRLIVSGRGAELLQAFEDANMFGVSLPSSHECGGKQRADIYVKQLLFDLARHATARLPAPPVRPRFDPAAPPLVEEEILDQQQLSYAVAFLSHTPVAPQLALPAPSELLATEEVHAFWRFPLNRDWAITV